VAVIGLVTLYEFSEVEGFKNVTPVSSDKYHTHQGKQTV
jgi:hypothetical protein